MFIDLVAKNAAGGFLQLRNSDNEVLHTQPNLRSAYEPFYLPVKLSPGNNEIRITLSSASGEKSEATLKLFYNHPKITGTKALVIAPGVTKSNASYKALASSYEQNETQQDHSIAQPR